MVNWEFMDNQTPQSATQLVDDLREGREVRSTRGPRICTWREAERVLAGFPDGRVDEGPAAGPASLAGLTIARERGWTAPEAPSRDAGDTSGDTSGDPSPAVPSEPGEKEQATADAGDSTSKAATVEEQAPTGEAAADKEEAQ